MLIKPGKDQVKEHRSRRYQHAAELGDEALQPLAGFPLLIVKYIRSHCGHHNAVAARSPPLKDRGMQETKMGFSL